MILSIYPLIISWISDCGNNSVLLARPMKDMKDKSTRGDVDLSVDFQFPLLRSSNNLGMAHKDD